MRLSFYFAIRNAAFKSAKAGMSMAAGWKEFSRRGSSNIEAYFGIEKAREYFKEAYLEANTVDEEEDGLLPFLTDPAFSKK